MKFNIARQTLVPAFLTLVALAAFAMWNAGSPAGDLPVGNPSPTGRELALSTPAELLARFQAACPGWSRWIGGFLILFVGMSLGRLTVRYNLYSVGTCLAIPLYGAITAGLLDKESFLTTLTAATLLALASRNYARSFCNGYGFDALFRASLYLGILMLIVPAALPFVLILPLAVALFRRTLRETVVAIAGLLLPILTFCYLNWGAGGDFIDPLLRGYGLITTGDPLATVLAIPDRELFLLGGILLLDLTALFYFLSDIYAVGTRSRAIFIFFTCLLLLNIPAACNPAANPAITQLTAIPSAVLLPFLFVRIHRTLSLTVYILLLTATVAIVILQ